MESLMLLRIIGYMSSILIMSVETNSYLTSTLQIGKVDQYRRNKPS